MIEYPDKPTEAFRPKDPVKIIDQGPGGKTFFTMVIKQDHQWLFTTAGVFNLAHHQVKAFRGIERYEDQGYC